MEENSFVKAIESVKAQMLTESVNVLVAILIIAVGWILAKLVSSIVGKILSRIGLDRLAQKLNQTETFRDANLSFQPVRIVKAIIFWIIVLLALLTSTETLDLQILSEQVGLIIAFIPQLVTAFVILVAGFFIADSVKRAISRTLKSMGVPAWKLISGLVFYLLMLVVAVTSLKEAGIDTAVIEDNFSIILGGILLAFAIGYGLAAKNVLQNMLSSYYSKENFELGQTIELDGFKGEIVKIDGVSVTIDTGETWVVMPQEKLLQQTVVVHKPKTLEHLPIS
ncbi:mechanosensitive ion channel family protein [Pontibacter sp. G13]|uniref:mechanosensitive ion channel family protein n=1 Tax=Pontibacter sp. G13 TaxID=3074898 RepID=UPI00288AB987|nr:hypothetical protein [Pontibacter sp. G13]WNJ21005.1 hypothetical protein RJD25_11080 [Pontibacter sp. G13]